MTPTALPPPDNEYGYFETTLEQLFGPIVYAQFRRWHAGQTCMLDDDGRVVVYTWDVMQFLAGGKDLEWDNPVRKPKDAPW